MAAVQVNAARALRAATDDVAPWSVDADPSAMRGAQLLDDQRHRHHHCQRPLMFQVARPNMSVVPTTATTRAIPR